MISLQREAWDKHEERFDKTIGVGFGRGEKISSCCAWVLVSLTCCCGAHESKLSDCLSAGAELESYQTFAEKLQKDLRGLYAQRSFVATASPKGNVQGQVQEGQPTVDLLAKPHSLPGCDAEREQNEKKGCCCRCCVTNDHDTYALPANTLLVETNLDIYDALDEYDEIATQFAYVSTFTIVIPVGSIMSLIRNLIEVHTDALHTFRDFRRPVPRMIDSKQVRNKPIALKPFSRHSA